MILFAKQKYRHRCREQVHGYQEGKGPWWDEWEIGTDIYTLLTPCAKWIMNEKLLYRMGNSTQCSLATWMGGKSKKKINVNI